MLAINGGSQSDVLIAIEMLKEEWYVSDED